jgi:hypothetical protein
MAPRALGAIEVVVIWFAFRIGIHFNCSDPPLNAAIVDPARDAEREWARLQQIGNTASRRLLLAVWRVSRRKPPAAGLQTERQSLARRAAEEP